MNRGTGWRDEMAVIIRWQSSQGSINDGFPMISRYFASLPRVRASKLLLAAAALAAFAVSDAAPARAGGYDGTWTTVFATTRGNCISGYSVPFLGERHPGVLGRRRPCLRLGEPHRRRCGSGLGRRLARHRRRPAGRQQRLRPLERHHHRRPLQRDLAGDAKLKTKKAKPTQNQTARRIIRRAVCFPECAKRIQRGASTITTWRPSNFASCSTLAISATSALTLSSSLVPISWCAISRPR